MLHNHSSFSVIDGKASIQSYLKLAQEYGQDFFALTDHGTLGGAIELYKAAKEQDIKPIIGCEFYVDAVDKSERDYPAHLTVLARNEAGYRALIAANNLAHRQFYYRPRISLQQIIQQDLARDWVVLSGCMSSLFMHYSISEAQLMIQALAGASGRFFLELMYHESKGSNDFHQRQMEHLEKLARIRQNTGLPLVWTDDCHFAEKETEDDHIKLVEQSQIPMGLEFDGVGFHYKPPSHLQRVAAAIGADKFDAVGNALLVAKECKVVIPEADTLTWYVPDITNGKPYQTIRQAAEPKLQGMPQEYYARFEYEMGVLATSPAILNSYLVAYDVVEWCKSHNIPMAARGSMAGSIVSWLLGITQEDPVRYNLKFERAVSPARPTIPDFDLDVSSVHRPKVLEYLQTRYTHNIPIASYAHYGPKGAYRKVLNTERTRTPQEINEMTSQLPDDWIGEEGYSAYSERKKRFAGKDHWSEKVLPEHRDAVALYKGLFSNMSVHPSGIIVSGPERDPFKELPLQWVASSKQMASAYDMYTLKKLGLFKLDVLGLRTLDQLNDMKRYSGVEPPQNDYSEREVLEAFTKGRLAEIFQMDGHACRRVIKDIHGIHDFEDIVAANTLARPGATQFTRYYRTGLLDIIREYPSLQTVLDYTNGLILYQEQVMEIAKVLADFNDAEQDDIKESIKYFKHEEFQQKIAPLFHKRCAAKGIDATNILKMIVEFSKYTFNRAHAMTYSAIAYKMMWYKVHYPAAFYASVYSASGDKNRLVLESNHFGVVWKSADINTSSFEATVHNKEVLLGLSDIKGLGKEAYRAISEARPFSSALDLEARVNKRKCNSKVRAALAKASALESIGQKGDPAAFSESFGFSPEFIRPEAGSKLLRLESWESDNASYRLGGFITGLREFSIKKQGPNYGKSMGAATVSNSKGDRRAVFFPDTWKRARGIIKVGQAVALEGEHPEKGDFIVSSGSNV